MFNFLKGLSVFSGTIIGVGIFGLPYVASKAGFSVVLAYFLFLTVIAVVIHLMYAEVSLGMGKIHQFPGAVGMYLGPRWKKFTFITTSFGLIGALLAYLIVGGNFLYSFFSPSFGGGILLYTLLFFAAGAFFIFRGVKSISLIELFLLLVFFVILGAFFAKSMPHINIDYLKGADLSFFILPYGVILFALWGSNIIPEVKDIVKGSRKMLRRVAISGTLLASVTYLFFIYVILGVSGPDTSKEAISGLVQALDNGIIRFGFIFGVITCFTSFITLGLSLKNILHCDFGVNRKLSWLITCSLPLLLFFAGAREFIEVIGLTGAVAVGIMGIIIVFLYKEFILRKFNRKISRFAYLLPAVFVLGVALEIFSFFAENIS
ncbi:MAG: aromatic amino acid transport family protein [Candidatus Paceibacterota bacterium]|jgi:tyrosine-specific transport protein|nr:aromatic amino acid transport family protein [Candidatus Paceibacterota bacterium]